MSSCVSGLVLGSVQQEAKEYIWKRKMIQVFNVPPFVNGQRNICNIELFGHSWLRAVLPVHLSSLCHLKYRPWLLCAHIWKALQPASTNILLHMHSWKVWNRNNNNQLYVVQILRVLYENSWKGLFRTGFRRRGGQRHPKSPFPAQFTPVASSQLNK